MALVLNASNTGSGGNAVVVSLTTTLFPGLICAACTTAAVSGAVVSVTATGLTFTKRTGIVAGSGEGIANWYAPYTSNFSGNVTVTPTNIGVGGTTTVTLFAIAGANAAFAASSFDANAPITDTAGGSSGLSLTTVNRNDLVFTNYLGSSLTTGVPGWIPISQGTQLVEYQILSSAQSVTGNFAAGSETGGILDAVMAAVLPIVTHSLAMQIRKPVLSY